MGSDKGLVEWEHELCALVVEVAGNGSYTILHGIHVDYTILFANVQLFSVVSTT